MSLVRDFIELITVHPGALVYHLVTLFAIQLIAGVTLGHWQRERDEGAMRLLVMGIGLFLARVVLMLIAVLDAVGVVSSTVVLPPLERLLHLITVLLVIWTFVPIPLQDQRLSTTLLLVTALLAAGTFAAFASLWPEAEAQGMAYNSYWQGGAWELSTAVIVGLAFVGSLVWRGPDWAWLICLLALWLVGHLLQLVAPTPSANTAGWVRLADLAGLPLLAALVYRRALGAATRRSREDATPPLGSVGVLEAVHRIRADDSLEAGLELATSSIADAMDADMAAVGLLVPSPEEEVLRIVALHPPESMIAGEQELTLPLSKHPLLAAASRSQHLERAREDRRSLVDGLYRRLGFESSGPLLAQPLITGEEVLGLILVGNPESQRPWNTHDEQILQALAYVLASTIAGDSRREAISDEQLALVREEAQRMASRVENLEARLRRHRRRSEELSTKLRLQETEAAEQKRASAALAVWQEEIHELAKARDALQGKLSEWQKRAESLSQAKTELEQRLEQVRPATSQSIDGRLGGILVSDEQGTIVLASQNAHQLLERSPSNLIGARLQDLFDEPWWKETVDRLLDGSSQPGAITGGKLRLRERMVRADLTRLPPSEHSPGTLVALFYLVDEPTADRATATSLGQRLRIPMTSIMGYTDLLLSERTGILGESQRHVLLRVEANIERMEKLLTDMIKATDLDTGQMKLSPTPMQMDTIIEDALETLSAQLDEKALEVKLDVPSELPPVHADRDSLQQIVLNLLSNAVLSSKPGTQIQMRARLEERADYLNGLPASLLVSVTDTGGGIAPEDKRRVFRHSRRGDAPLIPGLGDTGVGMRMAKALVEAHDGRIWVESEMGLGSTFSVLLPLSPPEKDREASIAGGAGGSGE